MKKLSLLLMATAISITVGCQAQTPQGKASAPSSASNAGEKRPADLAELDASREMVAELGVPTAESVAAAEKAALDAFAAGNCVTAIPALEAYSRQSNWLGNIVTASIKPYYDASYDDRKSFSREQLSPLADLERTANAYKNKRNQAFVMMAECYLKAGEREKAVPLLVTALDYIEADDATLWDKARGLLLSVVGVGPQASATQP